MRYSNLFHKVNSHGIISFFLIIIFATSLLILSPENAHAGYLDPGSGSTLVQGIIAIMGAIQRFWNALISPLKYFFHRKDS